jgi:hypothetical protein
MAHDVYIPILNVRIGRFLFLLISMVLYFVLRPFLEEFAAIATVVNIFITVILITAIYAVSINKTTYVIAVISVGVLTIVRWLGTLFKLPPLILPLEIGTTLFFIFLLVVILSYVFRKKEVTSDVIMGSICAYLILGVTWAEIYSMLEVIQPGSFQMPQLADGESSSFVYFSFVTLTTLGYGDMVPLTEEAKSLAFLEAIFGQLYLAILIARLVGTHIAQSSSQKGNIKEN